MRLGFVCVFVCVVCVSLARATKERNKRDELSTKSVRPQKTIQFLPTFVCDSPRHCAKHSDRPSGPLVDSIEGATPCTPESGFRLSRMPSTDPHVEPLRCSTCLLLTIRPSHFSKAELGATSSHNMFAHGPRYVQVTFLRPSVTLASEIVRSTPFLAHLC